MNKVVKRIKCPGAMTGEVIEFCNQTFGHFTNGWGISIEMDSSHGVSPPTCLEIVPVVLLYDSYTGSLEYAEMMIRLKWT